MGTARTCSEMGEAFRAQRDLLEHGSPSSREENMQGAGGGHDGLSMAGQVRTPGRSCRDLGVQAGGRWRQ